MIFYSYDVYTLMSVLMLFNLESLRIHVFAFVISACFATRCESIIIHKTSNRTPSRSSDEIEKKKSLMLVNNAGNLFHL